MTILTTEDLPKYSMKDIVLPTPGLKVTYPKNDLYQYYEQYLQEFGLTFQSFDHKQR